MDKELEKYKVELEEIVAEENHIELFFFMLGTRLPKEATHEELMKASVRD